MTHQDAIELLLFGAVLHVRDLFRAIDEHLKFLNHESHFFDIIIILRLLHQIVNAEAACNYEHQTLIKLGGDIEETLIVVGEVYLIRSGVPNHLGLLVVEELPDKEHTVQVVF